MTGTLFRKNSPSSPRDTVVIGIDASLTGFAIAAKETQADHFKVAEFKSKHRGVQRLFDIESFIRGELLGIKLRFDVLHVAMEGYSYGSLNSHSHALGECGGMVKMVLVSELGIMNKAAYPTIVPPTSLKKFTSGDGRAKKNQMSLFVYKKWGVDTGSDNEADAYALARVAQAITTGSTQFQYEREVVTKLEPHTEWTQPSPSPSLKTSPQLQRRRGHMTLRQPQK